MPISNEELVKQAESVVKSYKTFQDRLLGDVGAALVTEKGNVYKGACLDTGSGTGFCAEASAIAAMVTAGEYKIDKLAAVWKDKDGTVYVLPPCGRCRLFISQMDENNLETDIILGKNNTVKLKELLPNNEWPEPY